jgi:integrase
MPANLAAGYHGVDAQPRTGRPRYLARWRTPEREARMQVFDRLVDAKNDLAEVAAAWRPALRAAGLAEDRLKFQACRHWCASTLLAEGAPITAVAGHLGDTVETASRVYVHWLRDDRDVPAAVLDRVLAAGDALRARDVASDAGS